MYPSNQAIRSAEAQYPLTGSSTVKCLHGFRRTVYRLYFCLVYMVLNVSTFLSWVLMWLGAKLIFSKYPLGWLLCPISCAAAGDVSVMNREIHPKQCYMYYAMWRSVLTNEAGWLKHFKLPRAEIPVLFLYGCDKGTMFHTAASLAALDARNDGSSHMGFNAGHWFYHDFHEEVLCAIQAFLPCNPRQ